ncbi:MAG: sulfite exporter TauE/SafE family protein [Sinobacterium sp.]|nr:sulfite exporter TauE/SafE family protein [Sinobacterium sp.]
MLLTIIFYLFFGAFAGLIAGLFGVGGGVVIVPALIYAFTAQGVSADVLTHMAVGTSLAIICVTSISSVLAHHKNGVVLWSVVKAMVPGLVIGGVVGVQLASAIDGVNLQLIIGSFLLLVAIQMGFALIPEGRRALPSGMGLFPVAGVIGSLSAMFGIGGGSLTVPYLSVMGIKMQNAVATSAACGVPIAFASAIMNVYVGQAQTQGLELTWGFVYLPAFLGVAVMSAPFAKIGANLAKRLPAQKLKRLFAVFLVIIGSLMILKSQGIL